MDKMDKKSLKKQQSLREMNFAYKEQFDGVTEKYEKLKDIAKQVLKELNHEKEKQRLLRIEYEKLALEAKEKDDLIERMQSVSEAVIDEYSALKVKCDLEVEAATEASKRATKYFEENQKLKRTKEQELEDINTNVYENVHDSVYEDIPNLDYDYPVRRPQFVQSVSEIDMLNKELRTEIATLKVQLLKEIEYQNTFRKELEIAKDLYENEKREHNETRKKLESLQLDYNGGPVNESFDANSFETSIDKSTMTLEQDLESNSEDGLCEKTTADDSLSTATHLKLSEQIDSLKQESNNLTFRIRELEKENQKLRAETSATMSLPIPPPPPPPLPPPSFNPIKSLITFIHAGKKSGKPKKENVETEHQKAMSEMIDVIKKGQVHLKPTPKVTPIQAPNTEETALGEMKSILLTLKKKGKAAKESESLHDNKCFDESLGNASISSDVDDELKLLLRKRSLKSVMTDRSASSLSVAGSSVESLVGHEAECHIYSLSDLKLKEENETDSLIEDEAGKQVSSLSDSLNASENQDSEEAPAIKGEILK